MFFFRRHFIINIKTKRIINGNHHYCHLFIAFSFFFSGMEIAYVSSNKVYLSIEKRQNTFNASILNKLTEKPSQFITAMLVGNNVVLVIYGIYSGDLIVDLLENYFTFSSFVGLLLQTLISTAIILTAEFLPKSIFSNIRQFIYQVFCCPELLFLPIILFGQQNLLFGFRI